MSLSGAAFFIFKVSFKHFSLAGHLLRNPEIDPMISFSLLFYLCKHQCVWFDMSVDKKLLLDVCDRCVCL